jgi:hypothetical protein
LNPWPTIETDVQTCVNTAFPGSDLARWDFVTDVTRVDWEDLERQGRFAFPAVYVEATEANEWEDGPMDVLWWTGPITFWYCCQDLSPTANTPVDLTANLKAKLNALEVQLRTGHYNAMQVLDENFRQDLSPENRLNQHLKEQKLAITACSLSAEVLFPGADVPQL